VAPSWAVVMPDKIQHLPPVGEQAPAVGMRGHQGPIAGQRKAKRLHQAVHGIGREQPGTASAGGAGGAFHLAGEFVGDARVGGGHHGVHQVHGADEIALLHLARLHRPAGNEHGGDVEAQRRHQMRDDGRGQREALARSTLTPV